MMGILTAAGALARMLGPLWSTWVFQETHLYIVFIILAGSLLLDLLVMLFLYSSKWLPKLLDQYSAPPITTVN